MPPPSLGQLGPTGTVVAGGGVRVGMCCAAWRGREAGGDSYLLEGLKMSPSDAPVGWSAYPCWAEARGRATASSEVPSTAPAPSLYNSGSTDE